jgi:hypothetical protein
MGENIEEFLCCGEFLEVREGNKEISEENYMMMFFEICTFRVIL